jgi:tetratricopeptide (TPR) repeat protein
MKSIFAISILLLFLFTAQAASAQSVPLWVKNIAKFWAEDKITEKEFLDAIEFLIENDYIQIGDTKNEEKIELSATSTTKLIEEGVENLKEQDNELAILYFNEALKREPDNVKVLIDKGIATARTGKLDAAKAIFDQAIRLGENKGNLDYRAVINAGIAISIYGNQTDAMVYFDRVISNADNVDKNTLYAAYVNKGIAFYEQNKYEDALTQYDKAIEINPGRLGGIVNKANVLQEMGRYGEALTYFEQAYKITSDPLRWKPTFILVE